MNTQSFVGAQKLPRYFVDKSLLRLRDRLPDSQQELLEKLRQMLDDDGRVNAAALRDRLFPMASPNSGNTMLRRFLDGLNQQAAELALSFAVCTTASKKAGKDRMIWFEGLAEPVVQPHTSDLERIPEQMRMDDLRGQVIGRPVLLMTFNKHETQAVLKIFGRESASTDSRGGYEYTGLGVVGGQEIVHMVSGQGRKNAQAACAAGIRDCGPSAVIAVGIAFGASAKSQNIGDVLVSEYFYDYESARLNKDGSSTPRGPRPPASHKLLSRLRNLIHRRDGQTDWPKIHLGPILCGDKLIDDPAFLARILESEPEAVGGEMEAAGIEVAAKEQQVDWIIIKGISDWADGNKQTRRKEADQRLAAENAALVVRVLLDGGPVAEPREPAPERPAMQPAQPPQTTQTPARQQPPGVHCMGLGDLSKINEVCVDDGANGKPARLDGKPVAMEDDGDGTQVLPYLNAWIANPEAPPLFALLGEYGMGKTITSQLLASRLDEAHRSDPTAPVPLYFDLRHLTRLSERVPTLKDALEECMQRGWVDSGASESYTLENVHHWITQGAVAIFDGLDEVLVKLTDADGRVFTNNLLKLVVDARARARAEGRTSRLKVLMTCRTQYFPTLKEQNAYFTQSERGEFKAERYMAMLLLPWTEDQVRRYLSRALPEMDVERLLDTVRSVHNLQEMTERPYTLKLIGEFIPDIEQDRAAGKIVYGVTLYRKMAEKWLERDGGKHHIRPEHKLRLASHLAAHLWKARRSALPVDELNAWFHAWRESDPELERRYRNVGLEQLEEDLRTATFLSRQDSGEYSAFRFAHTSLHEFFVALHLFDAVRQNQRERWALPVPSRETLDFLGQLFGEAADAAHMLTLQTWHKSYQPQGSELILAYALRALACSWPAPGLQGIDLSGAKLRGWEIIGTREHPLRLGAANFRRAELQEARFEWVEAVGAGFSGAWLERTTLLHCDLRGADFAESQLTAAIFRACKLLNSKWQDAQGYRPQWLLCDPAAEAWADGPASQPTIVQALMAPLQSPPQANMAQLAWQTTGPSGMCCAWAPQADAAGRCWLATGGNDGKVRLWDGLTGEAGPVLAGHEGRVMCCAWAPQADAAGRWWLATGGGDGKVRLWDGLTGEAGPVLAGHEGSVMCCAWAPQADAAGRWWLATGGRDGKVRLWDGLTGEAGPVLAGHEGPVRCCAWAPQADAAGRWWLASGGSDGSLRWWDMTTNRCVRQIVMFRGGASARAGYLVLDVPEQKIITAAGEAWHHAAWLLPRPGQHPERVPLDTFGVVSVA